MVGQRLLANRSRLAQFALVVVIVSMALPWATGTAGAGYGSSEGRLVILVALATIAMIQLNWRPAWMGAGLIVATLVREFLAFGDRADLAPGLGIWIGIAAGASALIILIWSMFSDVAALAPPEGSNE